MKTVDSPLTNPFPGLRPFRSDEHHLFFGREEQTAALLQLLRTNRFLAVVGTSGSGKSSLVRAGMIAELHGGTMTRAGSTWEVMLLRPGGSPIENLARAFVDADLYDPEDPSTLPRLLATLNRSRFGLVEARKQCELFEQGTNLLVVVDQFEELFRFRQQGVDSEETAAAFVNLLLTASEQVECPIYVTITMRSDYLGDCSEIPGLAEAVNDGEYLIPRLLRDQKRDAIEKPVGVGGAKIAPMLVQRLLNDVGDDPDQLPVLQHALMRMWDAWSAADDHHRPIDFADFEATGGLGAALSNHADEIYDALPDDRHRAACEKIFKTLTEKGDDNRGIRRPRRVAQLQAIAASDRDTMTTVLEAYRGAGVTFVMPGTEVELADRTVLDLSHESLMRGWQRLRGWVEDEAQSARIFRRLLDTARLWSDGRAGLFRDPDLQIAISWREQEAPNAEWAEQYGGHFATAMGFLETSNTEVEAERQAREAARQRELEQARQLAEAQHLRLQQQQRAARRLRVMIAGLAAVALIAVLACVAALFANQRAITLAVAARQNEEKARQNEAKANQNAKRAEQSQHETASALAVVASQKAQVEGSLSKAEAAERLARTAEAAGRKLLYTTDMQLAPFVWRDDRSTAEQLRVLLAKHVPESKAETLGAGLPTLPSAALKSDLRGFEWYYYQHLLEQSAAVFSGHGVAVVGGALTSDGQLVTLDQDGQVRRWDLGSQAEDKASRRDLPGGPIAQVRVLSTNGRLAALAEGNKAHVFDTSTGKETFQIDSANVPTRGLIFSRDECSLVIVDDKIRWVSAMSGEVITSVNRKFERVANLALSPDGLTLAVAGSGVLGNQFSIFRLDATKKTVIPLATDVDSSSSSASALSPDGQRIAVGASLSGEVFVYDTATGGAIAEHRAAHASAISAIAFSGDGAKLATADAEGTIKIWADARKLNSKSTALVTLKGHHGAINTLGFSSDGKRLASTCVDKTAEVWDLENAGAAIRRLERTSRFMSFMARFSSDGQWIAADNGSSVRLWDAATGRPVRDLSAGGKSFTGSVAFSPNDPRLLAVGCSLPADVSYVALWDIDAGTELARLPVDERPGVGELAFSPDGKYLVAGFGRKWQFKSSSSPNPLTVWDVATRRLIRRLNGHTGYCVSLDFSRDGKLLASGSGDGTAIIWSTETWNRARTLRNPDPPGQISQGRSQVAGVAFSPDGKTLAVASIGGTVQLWDVATGELRESLKGHSSAVTAVAFSPDGRTLASGSVDQTVRLWNVATRRPLMQLDPGSVGMGLEYTLAFSPDGKHLLAAGHSTAFWSATPIVWNDADRAADKLRLLLQSNANFQTRIRMLSENLRLHEALAKLDAKDVRVQAALAATQANWHASRQAWPEAALAFDRLLAADPTELQAWLRTPGLLRVATALLHQDRPDDAAMLLQGGAKWRAQDPAMFRQPGLGFLWAPEGGFRLRDVFPGSPAARGNLLPGDVVVKVNGIDTANSTMLDVQRMIAGGVGTKVRLTVRHPGRTETQDVELVKANNLQDEATARLFDQLLAALEKRLANDPRDAGLLELRAELAGQESDFPRQVADCTAAIKILLERPAGAVSAPLRRLYRSRGDAYASLEKWPEAVADYARVVTAATTDDALLSNQALAQANLILEREAPATWTVLQPTEMKSKGGATLSKLPDDSILASGQNSNGDAYTIVAQTKVAQVSVIRLEALTHESLPDQGPGRDDAGNFAMDKFTITAHVPGRQPRLIDVSRVAADHFIFGLSTGNWNIGGGESRPHTAVYLAKQPVDCQEGARLQFQMQFSESSEWPRHNLGRFRLSVSSDPAAFDREQKLFPVMNLGDPWQRLAGAYRILGSEAAIDQLVQRRPKLAGPIGDLFTQGKDEGKDWRRAISLYSKAITAVNTDVDLLSKRARAREALKTWDAAAADWSRAAIGNPDAAKLLAEFARRLAAGGQVPRATAHFEKSRALYERALEAEPENDLVAPELAQALWDRHENENRARWTILKPTEMKSAGGATLTELEDHSILAGGANPPSDKYTVVFIVPERTDIQSIRLETLPHDSLPGKGPGRSTKGVVGAFTLNRWDWTAKGPDAADSPRSLSFRAACADYSWNDAPLGLNGEWNISFGSAREHTSVWGLPHPVTLEAGTELRSQLHFATSPDWSDQNLGRFRISVSSDPAAFDRELSRFAAMNLADPWSRLAAAYAVNGRTDQASQYFRRALERADGHEARKPIVEVAAWSDEVLSALIKRQPDDPQLQLAFARKLAEHGKKHLAEKQPARAQAELEKSREMITRLREKAPEPQWTVLKPMELKSARGTTLGLQSDGSIMASGKNPDQDTYTLTAPVAGGPIGGLRLETIPDERLDGGASFLNGAFFLTEIEAAVEAGDGGTDRLLAIKDGIADFAHDDQPVSRSFDHDPWTSWVTWPRVSEPHTAVFEFQPLSAAEDGSQRLKVRLESGSRIFPQRNLRRFRLSVTNRGAGLMAAAQVRNAFNDSDVVDLNVALAKAHAQQGHTSEAVASFTEALTLAADRAGKATIIAAAAPLTGVFEKLAERAAGDGLFQAELARHFAERGNAPLAATAQTRARASFERQLDAIPSSTVLASNLADILVQPIDAKTLVPTSENEGITWRYSTEQPPDNWMKKEFDDSAWSSGPGSFGGACPPGAVLRTPWTTKDIWLRHSFNWQPDPAAHALLLRIRHDEGFELFINGQPVYSLASDTTGYVFYPLDAKVLSVLKNGPNTMAVHCHGTGGNQYIDVGINAVPSDPSALGRRLAAMKIALDADPWGKLAAAYHAIGDQRAVDKLLKEHPAAVVVIGDLYAADQDWERAIAEYRKRVTDQPADVALLTKLAAAYQSAGRTREAVPLLATAYAANPKDTILSLKVSALQVWFGQDNDFAATRRLILSSAKGTHEEGPANAAAKACSILPFTDKAECEATLALGRTAVRAGNGGEWNLLARGMAEYRGGDYAAADKSLLAVAEAGPNNPQATGISAFYRAMNACRQGKAEEARKLAVAATSKMKPLPKDEKNPLAGGPFTDDLILWLAYKEAKALIQFDPPPAAPASPDGK